MLAAFLGDTVVFAIAVSIFGIILVVVEALDPWS